MYKIYFRLNPDDEPRLIAEYESEFEARNHYRQLKSIIDKNFGGAILKCDDRTVESITHKLELEHRQAWESQTYLDGCWWEEGSSWEEFCEELTRLFNAVRRVG